MSPLFQFSEPERGDQPSKGVYQDVEQRKTEKSINIHPERDSVFASQGTMILRNIGNACVQVP